MDEKDNLDKLVYIVIVNYNTKRLLNNCIRSIKLQKYANYKIIVVDNASKDKSVRLVEENFTDIIFIKLNKNVGFAGANNIGIRYALNCGADYILLLNPDTIVESDMLRRLVDNADFKTVTSPKIFSDIKKRNIWYAGGEMDYIYGKAKHLMCGKEKKIFNVSFMSGCCMLIHKNIFKKVGCLEEKYFMYYEDDDFCMRLMEKGITMLYIPDAHLIHLVGGSIGGQGSALKEYYMVRNRLFFIKKYQNYFQFNVLKAIIEVVCKDILCVNSKTFKYRMMALLGIIDYILGKEGEK